MVSVSYCCQFIIFVVGSCWIDLGNPLVAARHSSPLPTSGLPISGQCFQPAETMELFPKKPSRALEDDAATWKSEFLGSVMYNNKTGKHHQFGGTTLNLLVHNPFV